jgi:mannose-6-phosphate isomerase-like protein (cupin superfamily)
MGQMTAEGQVVVLNLAERLAAGGRGAILGLETEDLDINLVRLEAGGGVNAHTNREVDVLMVVVDGEGVIVANGTEYPLKTGQAIMIPKGTERSIRNPSESAFAYLSLHRRRRKLWPTVPQR